VALFSSAVRERQQNSLCSPPAVDDTLEAPTLAHVIWSCFMNMLPNTFFYSFEEATAVRRTLLRLSSHEV
jgi:hypothetical protein